MGFKRPQVRFLLLGPSTNPVTAMVMGFVLFSGLGQMGGFLTLPLTIRIGRKTEYFSHSRGSLFLALNGEVSVDGCRVRSTY